MDENGRPDEETLRELEEARETMTECACLLCLDKGRKFRMIELLEEHVCTWHLDYKPYKCGSCDQSFVLRMMWFAHAKTNHRGTKSKVTFKRDLYKEKLCRLLCISFVLETDQPLIEATMTSYKATVEASTQAASQNEISVSTIPANLEAEGNKSESMNINVHNADLPQCSSMLNKVNSSFLTELTEEAAAKILSNTTILRTVAVFCVRCAEKNPKRDWRDFALDEYRTLKGRRAHVASAHRSTRLTTLLRCFPDEHPWVDDDDDDGLSPISSLPSPNRRTQRSFAVPLRASRSTPSRSVSRGSVDPNSANVTLSRRSRSRRRSPNTPSPVELPEIKPSLDDSGPEDRSNGEQQLQYRRTIDALRGDQIGAARTPLPCGICGKEFFWQNVATHVLSHGLVFRCKLCGEVFGRRQDIRRHVEGVHRLDGESANDSIENREAELDRHLTHLAQQCFSA